MIRSTTTRRVVTLGAAASLAAAAVVSVTVGSASASAAPSGTAITSLSVVKGSTAGGTALLITGTKFDALTTPKVYFGSTIASNVIYLSATQIAAVAPAGTGKVDVQLADGSTVYDGLAGTADDFTYLVPYTAVVTAGAQMSSLGGTTLRVGTTDTTTLTGGTGITCAAGAAAFTAAKVTATVNGAAATAVKCVDDGHVDITVPAGTIGNATLGANAKVALFHDSVAGTPDTTHAVYAAVISLLDKTSGPTSGTSTITVTGKGFTGSTGWKFGTTAAANVTVVSDTKVTLDAPAASAGAVSVNFTPADSAVYGTTSKATFTYSDLG